MPNNPSSFKPLYPILILPAIAIVVALFMVQTGNLKKENKSLVEKMKSLEKNVAVQKEFLDKVEGQKIKIINSMRKVQSENQALAKELETLKNTMTSTADEKTYLEDILIHKTKEIESLSRQVQSQSGATSPVPSSSIQELEAQLKQKNIDLARLSEQNQILSKKMEKLYKMANDKISEINVAKIALEDTIAKARTGLENEWSSVDLGSIQTSPKENAAPAAAKKEGKVLAVNDEHGFVVVDLGKNDGIKPGAVFTVSQDGASVATLNILEVRDVMSACNVQNLSSGHKIRIGDPVKIGG